MVYADVITLIFLVIMIGLVGSGLQRGWRRRQTLYFAAGLLALLLFVSFFRQK